MDEKWKVVGAEKTNAGLVMITSGWADTWLQRQQEKKGKTVTTPWEPLDKFCKIYFLPSYEGPRAFVFYVFILLCMTSIISCNIMSMRPRRCQEQSARAYLENMPVPHTQMSLKKHSFAQLVRRKISAEAVHVQGRSRICRIAIISADCD